MYIKRGAEMAQEKVLSFVEARANLSGIVDQVNEQGRTYVIAKREKPVAVIIGLDRYRKLTGEKKYLRRVKGRQILKIKGIATGVADIDEAIRKLRSSRIKALTRSF